MMTMPEAMKEATHSLLQRGEKMRTYDVKHPPSVRDMTNAYDTHARSFRTDSKGGVVSKTQSIRLVESATLLKDRKRSLQMQKQRNPWYAHQPIPTVTTTKQYCAFEQCPGLKIRNKRKRSYTSVMKCEECSVMNNKDTYYCCSVERGTKKIRNCHYKHHTLNFSTHNKYKNKP